MFYSITPLYEVFLFGSFDSNDIRFDLIRSEPLVVTSMLGFPLRGKPSIDLGGASLHPWVCYMLFRYRVCNPPTWLASLLL